MDAPAGQKVVGRIEINLLENGQILFKTQVPSRFVFNAMMETCKQNSVADLMKAEQQKVVLPEIDPTRLTL